MEEHNIDFKDIKNMSEFIGLRDRYIDLAECLLEGVFEDERIGKYWLTQHTGFDSRRCPLCASVGRTTFTRAECECCAWSVIYDGSVGMEEENTFCAYGNILAMQTFESICAADSRDAMISALKDRAALMSKVIDAYQGWLKTI